MGETTGQDLLESDSQTLNGEDELQITPDGGVRKVVLEEGQGDYVPSDGDRVRIHYVAKDQNGEIVGDSKKDLVGKEQTAGLEFVLGKKFSVEGWEHAVKTMKVRERARVYCKPLYGAVGFVRVHEALTKQREKHEAEKHGHAHHHHQSSCGCSGALKDPKQQELEAKLLGQTLEFDMRLESVDKAGEYEREYWQMTTDDKLSTAKQLREEGNALYKKGEYSEAAQKFGKAQALLELVFRTAGVDEEKEVDALTTTCALNLAAARLATKEYKEAIDACSKVIAKDPENLKAIFRRGQARLQQGRDLELAREDLKRASELAPNMKEIRVALDKLKRKEEQHKAKEKNMYKGMFA